jgi:hypothetical protein
MATIESNSEMIIKLQEMKYDDGLGNLQPYEPQQFHSFYEVPEERKAIYAESGCFSLNDKIYGVKYVKSDGNMIEHLIQESGENNLVPIYCECGISYEPLSPSGNCFLSSFLFSYVFILLTSPPSPSPPVVPMTVGMVEYQYDPNGPWRLAKISLEPLEAYKASKFTLWRGMLEKPSCLISNPFFFPYTSSFVCL